MINKKNYFIRSILLIFVLSICLILHSCKSCKKETVTLEINNLSETLYVGEQVDLTYNSSKENIEVFWQASDNNLVKIEGNKLTPLKEGTVTIKVYYKDNEEIFDSCTCSIIKRKVEKLEINIDVEKILMGESIELSATVYPTTLPQEVTWSILDNQEKWEVAEINGNILTAIKYGKVYITAQSVVNSLVSETIAVEVLHPLLENEEIFEAKYIRGAFGEDASSMYTVQYTTYNSKSYALLTTSDDPEFLNAKKYYGEGYYFEDLDELLIEKFEGRNIWRIEMTDLESNTEYIYKINKGNDTYYYNLVKAFNDAMCTGGNDFTEVDKIIMEILNNSKG